MSTNLQIAIGGMQCSFCRQSVERALQKVPGVHSAAVNLAHEEALIAYDGAEATQARVAQTLRSLGYSIRDREKLRSFVQAEQELDEERRRLLIAGLIAGSGLVMMIAQWSGSAAAGPWVSYAMALGAVFMLAWGRRFLGMAWAAARRGILNQHVLLSLSALGAFAAGAIGLFRPSFPAVDFFGAVVLLMSYHTLSSFVAGVVRTRASQAVRKLLELQPATARVLRDGEEVELAVADIAVGETVRVRPGERIPLDGWVVAGVAAVDESMVTGEPLPVTKQPGTAAIAGSMNTDGMLAIRVGKPSTESFVARVAREVEAAKALKPAILVLVERILAVYVPVVLGAAVAALAGWLLAAAVFGVGDGQRALFAALSVLVMGYPCALGMATPLALIRGGGEAAARGILVRSAEAFQTLRDVRVVVFDKTGTLTEGKPRVIGTVSAVGTLDADVLATAAALERYSRHPLAVAIHGEAQARALDVPDHPEDFREAPGRGVSARLGASRVLVGSPRYLQESGVALPSRPQTALPVGATPVGVARDGRLLGFILLGDSPRPDAEGVVRDLRRRGIEPVMVTGDNRRAAEALAARLGITRVHAQTLPDEKAGIVRELQRGGARVAMVGDGINDAPALMQADIGVAFDAGTDIAIESADAVVMSHRLGAVADLLDIGKRSYAKTAQNLAVAFAFNGIGIPLAATGLLQPVWAMAAMAASITAVLANSFGGPLIQRSAGAS